MYSLIFLVGLLLFTTATEGQHVSANRLIYAQRGSYAVGTREMRIDDMVRPLVITIWYPAMNPEDAAELVTYKLNALVGVTGHALRDAVPDTTGAPYPLVVFSHGSGSSRFLSLFFLEHLASHGIIVIAAEHSGNAVMDALQPEKFAAVIPSQFAYRPEDVLRQIHAAETLTMPGGEFAGLIDVSRVAVSGHSFGGYTALAAGGARLDLQALHSWCADPANAELDPYPDVPFYPLPAVAEVMYGACFMREEANTLAALRALPETPSGLWPATTDPRIKAVAVFAPWNAPIFGAKGLAALSLPTLVVVGSADHVTLPERDAYQVYQHVGSATKALVVLQEADHFVFIDECPPLFDMLNLGDLCNDPVWEMRRAHDVINHFTTAFLLAVLKDDATAQRALSDYDHSAADVRYTAVWP